MSHTGGWTLPLSAPFLYRAPGSCPAACLIPFAASARPANCTGQDVPAAARARNAGIADAAAARTDGQAVWVHAASVGESLSGAGV